MTDRILRPILERAAAQFGAVILTGPRRAGKTTLLRATFPDAQYVLLEDPDTSERANADPRGFLHGLSRPVILDEVQYVPDLLRYIRTLIDQNPEKKGAWLLTGSQEAPLMQGVSESMAGRAAILQLWPFSTAELGEWDLVVGGYPEVVANPEGRDLWFASYIQTYLERDVRTMVDVRDLGLFRRFLTLVASRHGQFINKAEMAGPLGLSVPTITRWLDVLEATGQILLVPPYFDNFGKRLVKSPKLYLTDSGLACFFLGLRDMAALERSPFLGAVFEGYVASEIAKRQMNLGRRRELYTLRDSRGFEIDFVTVGEGLRPTFIEVKASHTVRTSDARALEKIAIEVPESDRLVLYRGDRSMATTALVPGVQASTATDYFGRSWA